MQFKMVKKQTRQKRMSLREERFIQYSKLVLALIFIAVLIHG